MSELIDRIFDVEKISGEISTITANIEGLKGVISTYYVDVKKLMDNARAAKDQQGLTDVTKGLNDALIEGSKVTKEYQNELDKLKAKKEALTGAEKNANIEIAKARLELVAAQKEVKAAAVAEIEAAAATGKLGDSYNDLQNDLKKSMLAYKSLTAAERESAKGKELIAKINQTQTSLKEMDAGMQVYNRNVGNYASAVEGLMPKIGGLPGVLLNTEKAAISGEGGFKSLGKTIAATGKAMLANPFVLIGAAIVMLIKGISDAIGESEKRTNAISSAMAQFKPVLRTIGDGFEFLADAVIKTVGFLGKAFSAVTEFLGINPKGSADQFVQAEKSKQKAVLETRKLNEESSDLEAIIAEQRAITGAKEEYTIEQRVEALKKAGEAEKKLADNRAQIAELNLKALQEEAALDDNNAEMNDKVSAAIVAVNAARRESASIRKALAREETFLIRENKKEMESEAAARKAAAKEKADAEKEAAKNIMEAQRRLIDSKIAIMAEGEEKQIAMNAESFKRKLEDLKYNGQLTSELEKNLTTANAIEVQKIRDDFAKKKADNDKSEIDKAITDLEKNMQKEADVLAADYRQKETDLKAEYAKGKKTKEQYEAELLAIQSKALKEANDKTIKSLQEQLEIAGINEDKRVEISAKLRDLQIANENAVLDATIEANQKKVDSDKDAFEKRLQIAEQLTAAGMELFQAIGDFQAQQSENRLAEIEKQQNANDDYFARRQENLNNAIMSDESRAMAQKKIDDEKAKRDAEILKKQQAEKVKQAKWEKAQALISAIVGTATATVGALGAQPWSLLNFVFAGLAAAAGAAQIATIVSKQIPAYKEGGITGDGYALWGEVRPEVAVTRTGDIMFAENPTVSKFDAGTRIFKSVEDYERNVSMTRGENFKFDYDKMASKFPATQINLDSSGLWSIVNKEQQRATMINRRYKIG